MDFCTGTSFSKFPPIFVYLERVTHTKKSNIWGKKNLLPLVLFTFYSNRLIKCPFPKKLASQNSLQNKDRGKTFKCRSNRRRKAKGKKRAGEKDRYRFIRDVQSLASVNAPKKLLNLSVRPIEQSCVANLFFRHSHIKLTG